MLLFAGCGGDSGGSSGAVIDEAGYQIVFQTDAVPQSLAPILRARKPLPAGGLFLIDSATPGEIVQLAGSSSGRIVQFRVLVRRRALLYDVFGVPGEGGPGVHMISLDGERQRVDVAPGQLTMIPSAISANERWIAARKTDASGLVLVDLDDPSHALEIPNSSATGTLGPMVFSQDSARLLFTVAGRLFSIALDSPSSPVLLFDPGSDRRVGRLYPSSDNDFIVLTADYRRATQRDSLFPLYDLFALEASSGRLQRLGGSIPRDQAVIGDYAPVSWDGDRHGEVFYVVTRESEQPIDQLNAPGEVRRVRLDSPTESCLMSEGLDHGSPIRAMTRSPYDGRLAFQLGTGAWRLVDPESVDCLNPDAGIDSAALFEVSGFPVFVPDGRSAIMGNSLAHQPEHEAAGLFHVDLGSPADGVTINAPLAEDELIMDYRLLANGRTAIYVSRPRRCIGPDGVSCQRRQATGLYSVDVARPGDVTTWLDADASVGLMNWLVVSR